MRLLSDDRRSYEAANRLHSNVKKAGIMGNIATNLDKCSKNIRPYVPFTVLNTVIRTLDKNGESILDVGCGKGIPMQVINRNHIWQTTGVDGFEPYLEEARERKSHDTYILSDIRNMDLPPKSYDIVLCMEVLEHFDKEEGMKLLSKFEEIARRQIIITTPQGEYEQHALDDNDYQEHKYMWKAAELMDLGYMVRGHGLPYIGGDEGIASHLPDFLIPLTNIPYVLAGPLVYYIPRIAGALVAIKRMDTDKIHRQ